MKILARLILIIRVLSSKRTVRVRFAISLIAALFRAMLGFLTSLLLARFLGPAEFGNLNFLLASFGAISVLLDGGSSHAFNAFISQEQRNSRFFLAYGSWLLCQLLILIAIVLFTPETWASRLWPNQPRELLPLAAVACFAMNQIWNMGGQIGESIRFTVGVQVRNVAVALVNFMAILLLGKLLHLSVEIVLWVQLIVFLSFSVGFLAKLGRMGSFHLRGVSIGSFGDIVRSFWAYCRPLAGLTILGFFFSILDPWLLQRYAGSTEQGFFAIGFRFCFIATLFSGAMVQIYFKEVSEAFAKNNIARLQRILDQTSRFLYFVAASIGCFLTPFASEILALTVGPGFQNAAVPLAILFLYPLHNVLNIVIDMTFLATFNTQLKGRIGVFFVTLSMGASYFLLAPSTAMVPGLGLGATGLALKLVVCQFIQSLLAQYYLIRVVKLHFDWRHQFYLVALLLPIAFGSKVVAEELCGTAPSAVAAIPIILLSSLFYGLIVFVFVRSRPKLAGLPPGIFSMKSIRMGSKP